MQSSTVAFPKSVKTRDVANNVQYTMTKNGGKKLELKTKDKVPLYDLLYYDPHTTGTNT